MGKDVYRRSPVPDARRRLRVQREELVIPVLALAVGGLMLVIALWNGTPRPTEGGLGTIFLLFGIYALVEAFRSMPPRGGTRG